VAFALRVVQVPPFSGAQGRAIIEAELGISLDRTFSEISLDPVASASIGQVYRATMREGRQPRLSRSARTLHCVGALVSLLRVHCMWWAGGQEVAIKVQRPNVLYNVALDLYMLREILVPLYQKVNPESNTDLRKLVDAWGEGFVNELDYRLEATATAEFSQAMVERGLGSVIAPEVVTELSSAHVLTTKWVDGQRLADSDADDVPRLCGVALNGSRPTIELESRACTTTNAAEAHVPCSNLRSSSVPHDASRHGMLALRSPSGQPAADLRRPVVHP
jgi:predicted unusual protein kinase regulating ubiquinone biosynthesis (AarF/ABC1/UbiB family)